MNDKDRSFESQVPPWDDQEPLQEQDAIDRMEAAVRRRGDGCKEPGARSTVIAIGNYVWQSQDWPALDRARERAARRARGQALAPLGMN